MSVQPRMNPIFKINKEIAFNQCDPAGILHFAEYLVLMEQCEHAFLKSVGISPFGSLAWPRVACSCDFSSPLRPGDVVTVNLLEGDCGTTSVNFKFSVALAADGTVAATGELKVVCCSVGDSGRPLPQPLPKELRDSLANGA